MGGRPIQPVLPFPAPDHTDEPPPLLLVDGHHLLWSATFGFPAPIYSRDKTRLLTGTFAFFALLRVAIRDDLTELGSPEVIVVFDGEHGTAARKQDHDGYKGSRPDDEAARLPLQFLPDVKRGLDNCGITWAELEHAEADDLIASIAHATQPPRQVIIMSGDKDYYQLVTDRVTVLNTRFRTGRKLITPGEVFLRHQVTPAQWTDYRALAGDPADDIPGVHGIGTKTAATLLADGMTLDDLPASGRLDTGRGRVVAENIDLARKWRDMIRLDVELDPPSSPTGQPSAALPKPADIIEELGLW